MNLDESQRNKVVEWIGQGLKLSEIQNRLGSELGITMTYMDVRLLVDDLKLTPKDPEPPKPAPAASSPAAAPAAVLGAPVPEESAPAPASGSVSVTVDQLARAGALVSGKVVFSDGNTAAWYLDQSGRLGLSAQKQGYRPSAPDLQDFQAALEAELAKLGL